MGATAARARTALRPVLDGEFWVIGDHPDLGALRGDLGTDASSPHTVEECVDHHIFRSEDGRWHLWGCMSHTAIGRLFYRWESGALTDQHWEQTGEVLRADRQSGESLDDLDGQEWLQSPFVVLHKGTYYMFYGGHSSRSDEAGNPVPTPDPRMACQMCLMLSEDGRAWRRHKNECGQSRVFLGPGEVRDACLLKSGQLWLMYYAGYHNNDFCQPGFYCRVSTDLLHWSRWMLVHYDIGGRFGSGRWNCECPHVVEREGYYYLFRTEEYPSAKSHVFRSENPFDFGVGDAGQHYVCSIGVAAPELITDGTGQEYISSCHESRKGVYLSRLRWVEDG